jgi:hypothetical protein
VNVPLGACPGGRGLGAGLGAALLLDLAAGLQAAAGARARGGGRLVLVEVLAVPAAVDADDEQETLLALALLGRHGVELGERLGGEAVRV